MQCPHIFACIAQFIDISDFATLNNLGATCNDAKKVRDTILIPYLSDPIYVEHDNEDKWRIYRVADLTERFGCSPNIPPSFPFIGVKRRYGLTAYAGYDIPSRFITTRKDLMSTKIHDDKCGCYKCRYND